MPQYKAGGQAALTHVNALDPQAPLKKFFADDPKPVNTAATPGTWDAKQANLKAQQEALDKLKLAAQQQVSDLQKGYDTSTREGLEGIRYQSQGAMAAQRGRNPYDIAGARQTALSRGATEAGFIGDQAAKWQPAISSARTQAATTESEVLGKQRQLLDAAQASRTRANQSLAAAQKIVDDATSLFNTASDREAAAQAIEKQLLAGEDDPVVRDMLQDYIDKLRGGEVDAAGLDIPSVLPF